MNSVALHQKNFELQFRFYIILFMLEIVVNALLISDIHCDFSR